MALPATTAGLASTAAPHRPALQRALFSTARILAVSYLGVLLAMSALENSLIYFPSVYPEGDWQPHGLEFEDAWFAAADGTQLHGWYVPHTQPRGVLLFAHGNAGNLSDRGWIVKQLVDRLRLSVMIFDYRGYGRSHGEPDEPGVIADARAARAWLAQRAGIAERQVILFGESLGGGVMVDLAASDGARALVLDNTFSSMPEVASFHYPWLPVKLLMRSRFDSAAKIGRYHGPLLQVHGSADTIVPLALAEKLFAAANEPKRLVVVPGGDHNDPPGQVFFSALDQFVAQLD